MKRYTLEKFVPPNITKQRVSVEQLNHYLGKNMNYAVDGKTALYRILESFDIKGLVLVPTYICDSILYSFKKSGLEYICYDLDMDDLNASIESIKRIAEEQPIKACLVASMYGNPANLVEIEKYCSEKNIILIDDAAQAFGSELEGRKIGTFGDAGFFSLACGKPVVSSLGAFYWVKNDSQLSETKTGHRLFHKIAYWDYLLNRVKIYENGDKYKWLYYLRIAFWKLSDITNDGILDFEEPMIGGAVNGMIEGKYSFRNDIFEVFKTAFADNEICRLVVGTRGITHPHKLVFIVKDRLLAEDLLAYSNQNGFFSQMGYRLLSKDAKTLTACSLDGRIIEFPIENDLIKMNKLKDFLISYMEKENEN